MTEQVPGDSPRLPDLADLARAIRENRRVKTWAWGKLVIPREEFFTGEVTPDDIYRLRSTLGVLEQQVKRIFEI